MSTLVQLSYVNDQNSRVQREKHDDDTSQFTYCRESQRIPKFGLFTRNISISLPQQPVFVALA